VPDTECEEWDTMKAWLRWDEYDQWFADNVSPHGIRGFTKGEPVIVASESEIDEDGEEMVLVKQMHEVLPICVVQCYVPVKCISLEPLADL
jgi:hypothetical protein